MKKLLVIVFVLNFSNNFSQVSFKIHPGASFIKDDLCEIVIGASISFQKENLIYSLEFYSANEVGLFLPDPPQYFNQLGVLIGKKKNRIQYSLGLTVFSGEKRTTNRGSTGGFFSTGLYNSERFSSIGIASKIGFDLIKNKRFLMSIDLNTNLNYKYSAFFPVLSFGYNFNTEYPKEIEGIVVNNAQEEKIAKEELARRKIQLQIKNQEQNLK